MSDFTAARASRASFESCAMRDLDRRYAGVFIISDYSCYDLEESAKLITQYHPSTSSRLNIAPPKN
eukprot:SAG11_NODE_33738_length_275_cov_1.460227_1_plen_65_part_01